VLWADVAGDLAGLHRLQRAVEQAGARLGFRPDARGFNPHLTLGRVDGSLPPAGARRLVEALEATSLPAASAFRVDALSLMRSDLRPGGSVYTRLFAAPLGGVGRNGSPC
jgi:2'-5' RNA ligase